MGCFRAQGVEDLQRNHSSFITFDPEQLTPHCDAYGACVYGRSEEVDKLLSTSSMLHTTKVNEKERIIIDMF